VNFNHLMETKYIKRKCSATNTECYFIPAGNVRSTAGENVHMTLYCKKCGRREDIFLSKEEFFTQQRLIQKEIGDA
jgi:transcription initiation factor IIE alpha subunit